MLNTWKCLHFFEGLNIEFNKISKPISTHISIKKCCYFHEYRILVDVIPNIPPPSPLTSYCSSLTTHYSHDSTPQALGSK